MPTEQEIREMLAKRASAAETAEAELTHELAKVRHLAEQVALKGQIGKFITKDSGKRETFDTGARRDLNDDKPGYDQIPVYALERIAFVYTRGAKKYGRDNWKKGIPFTRMLASALRHVFQFCQGHTDEDHLGQAAWNIIGLMYYEWAIQQGKLPASLDDRDLPVKKLANAEPAPPLPEAPLCPETKKRCVRVPPCVSNNMCAERVEKGGANGQS